MNVPTDVPSLKSLEYFPYLDENGSISEDFMGKIGVYAIFNQNQELQFVGYSRDIYVGLKQSLICQPQQCYWVKLKMVQRPSRTVLEGMREAWIAENGKVPPGNGSDAVSWNPSIDVKPAMTEEDQEVYDKSDELGKGKLLKKVARRVEAKLKEALKIRGVTMEIRFNPKLKEKGILSLK